MKDEDPKGETVPAQLMAMASNLFFPPAEDPLNSREDSSSEDQGGHLSNPTLGVLHTLTINGTLFVIHKMHSFLINSVLTKIH